MSAPARPVYLEHARSYLGVWLLAVLLAGGCAFDTVRSGSLVHLIGWLVAAVLVLGINILAVRTARTLRTVTVTERDVRVGSASVDRASITGVERDVDRVLPILGHHRGESLPRGVAGLTLVLADGSRVTVPTRFPGELARILDVLPAEAPDVRPAEAADLPILVDIEQRATTLYRVAGMPLPKAWSSGIADIDEPSAVFVVGRPAFGFIQLVEVDGVPNIAVLGLVPGRVRGGFGTALLDAACAWAREQGYSAITVTTYADIPWNAPFFTAYGFVEVTDIGPAMAELRDWERAVGLDAVAPRIVMRREL